MKLPIMEYFGDASGIVAWDANSQVVGKTAAVRKINAQAEAIRALKDRNDLLRERVKRLERMVELAGVAIRVKGERSDENETRKHENKVGQSLEPDRQVTSNPTNDAGNLCEADTLPAQKMGQEETRPH